MYSWSPELSRWFKNHERAKFMENLLITYLLALEYTYNFLIFVLDFLIWLKGKL